MENGPKVGTGLIWCEAPSGTWHVVDENNNAPCNPEKAWIGGPMNKLPPPSECCKICMRKWEIAAIRDEHGEPPVSSIVIAPEHAKEKSEPGVAAAMYVLLQNKQSVPVEMFTKATTMYFATGDILSKLRKEVERYEQYSKVYSDVMAKFIDENPTMKSLK